MGRVRDNSEEKREAEVRRGGEGREGEKRLSQYKAGDEDQQQGLFLTFTCTSVLPVPP